MKLSDTLILDSILIGLLIGLLGIVVAVWFSTNADKSDKEFITLGIAFFGYFIYNELTKKYSSKSKSRIK